MTTKPWWVSAKIYELYVDTFAGSFSELEKRLEYFTFLGINTLHILPHYPSPGVDGGYDVSDYKAVNARLGTLSDFKRCVGAAHARGIRVLIDLVLNHTSDQHPWFLDARASRQSSYRDYYVWSDVVPDLRGVNNAFPDFKTSNWVQNDATQDFYYATFFPEQPDLNWRNPAVLSEFFSVIDFWVNQGVDGFRLDAAPYLCERGLSATEDMVRTHRVIQELRSYVDRMHRGNVAFLAEVGGDLEQARSFFGDSNEAHMVYHFPLMREILLAFARRDDSRVRALQQSSFPAPHTCQWATFVRNHDDVSIAPLSRAEQQEVLAFIDPERAYLFANNTTSSVRLANICKQDFSLIIKVFELLYSLPGAPVMYYGDEIGMRNEAVRVGVRDSRIYVRGQFDWERAQRMRTDSSSLLHQTARIIHDHAVR